MYVYILVHAGNFWQKILIFSDTDDICDIDAYYVCVSKLLMLISKKGMYLHDWHPAHCLVNRLYEILNKA